MTYDEMIAAILGAKNNMDTKPVPLTTEQIKLLRDALNLAAEYTAQVDDPLHYSEWDQQRINQQIEGFRQLDNYLQQFEPEEEHRPVTHKCHGGQTLYGTREDCLFCKNTKEDQL